jgi:hypothetical protein
MENPSKYIHHRGTEDTEINEYEKFLLLLSKKNLLGELCASVVKKSLLPRAGFRGFILRTGWA